MSKFFKALEQAEHDRALREQARRPDGKPAAAPPPSPMASREVLSATVVAPPAPPAARPTEPARDPADRRSVGRVWTAEAPRPKDRAEGPWGEIDEHLVSLLNPTSPDAEQYRALRHAVEQLHRSAGLTALAVSSPTVGDGKTTTAINLAGALAQDPEARILLLDADLRRPSVGDRLGLRNSRERGLVDLVLGADLTLDDVVRRRPAYNLSVLAAGRSPAAPYEVLKSPRLGNLLDQARQQYDFIVLDTPPIVLTQDCTVVERDKSMEAMIDAGQDWMEPLLDLRDWLAATQDPSRKREFREVRRRNGRIQIWGAEADKIVGFVFNDDARSLSRYCSYGYTAARHDEGGGWRRAMTRIAGSFRQRPSF